MQQTGLPAGIWPGRQPAHHCYKIMVFIVQGMVLSKKVAVIPSPLQVHQSYPVQLQFPQPGPAWLHPVLLWFPERGTGVIQLQWGQRTPGALFIAPVIQNRAKIKSNVFRSWPTSSRHSVSEESAVPAESATLLPSTPSLMCQVRILFLFKKTQIFPIRMLIR